MIQVSEFNNGNLSLQNQTPFKMRPTKRAADVWESAPFSSSFLAWIFFCFQVESPPTHTRLTQTVGQPSAKTKSSLNHKFCFIVEFRKTNSLFF
jgi:hypothetical protein